MAGFSTRVLGRTGLRVSPLGIGSRCGHDSLRRPWVRTYPHRSKPLCCRTFAQVRLSGRLPPSSSSACCSYGFQPDYAWVPLIVTAYAVGYYSGRRASERRRATD